MKKKIIWLVLIIVLSTQSVILSGCVAPNDVRIYEDEIIESLKNDYEIVLKENYGTFKLSKGIKNYPYLKDYEKVDEKLSKWAGVLRVLYIKTDKGEDKFVYFPNEIAKKSIKVNGEKITAETKDYIYITDFPFTYTYDEIYEQCSFIADINLKSEMLNAFNKTIGNIYLHIYPIDRKISFNDFTNEEATLINSKLVDKELVFTLGALYNNNSSYYYFFFIKENDTDNLFIYKEGVNHTNSKIIYPSEMSKDAFISHLNTLN